MDWCLKTGIGDRDRTFLTKLNAQANTVWDKLDAPLPTVASTSTNLGATKLVERSGYYAQFVNLTYQIYYGGYRRYFAKDGSELSFRNTTVDNLLAYTQTERISDVAEAVDGGIIIALHSAVGDRAYLARITEADTSFTLRNSPTLSPGTRITRIVPASARDGYFIVTNSNTEGSKLLKLAADGSMIWGVALNFTANQLVADPNGVVVGGVHSNRVIISKHSLTGTAIWQTETTGTTLSALNKTPDGGYVIGTLAPSKTFPTFIQDGVTRVNYQPTFTKFSSEQSSHSLALLEPQHDCSTNTLYLFVTGGNGRVEFRVPGLGDWTNINLFYLPTYQSNGTTFTLEARENGYIVSRTFTTACGTTTPPSTTTTTPPTGSFAVQTPAYDCNTGQLTAQVANAGSASVEYRIIGLRDWDSSPAFSVPSYQRAGTTFKVEARTNGGAYASTDFATACGTTTPPVVTPPSGSALAFGQSSFDCGSGQLTLTTSGGNGNSIEYRIPGLADWQPSAVFIVPSYQRQNTSFTLYARQSGSEINTTFTTNCPTTARVANPEGGQRWRMEVLGNPVEERVQVRLNGDAGQTIRLRLNDASGRIITERAVELHTAEQTETLQVGNSAGVYVLGAESNGQRQSLKILKK